MNVNYFVCSLQQCCFFYPLRKGLLVWGYLNLLRYCVQDGISSTLTAERIRFHHNFHEDEKYEDLLSITLMFVATLTLSLANLAFNIVFVVGLHKRDDRLLRSHYYYWIVTLVLYIVLLIALNTLSIIFKPLYDWLSLHVDPVSYYMALERPVLGIFDILLQFYFLILVRNKIRILDKGDQIAIIDPLDSGVNSSSSRPQSMGETVRNAIQIQPKFKVQK